MNGYTVNTNALVGYLVEPSSLHDAMLVVNHRARGTDAIVTRDPDLGDARNVTALWE